MMPLNNSNNNNNNNNNNSNNNNKMKNSMNTNQAKWWVSNIQSDHWSGKTCDIAVVIMHEWECYCSDEAIPYELTIGFGTSHQVSLVT